MCGSSSASSSRYICFHFDLTLLSEILLGYSAKFAGLNEGNCIPCHDQYRNSHREGKTEELLRRTNTISRSIIVVYTLAAYESSCQNSATGFADILFGVSLSLILQPVRCILERVIREKLDIQ